MNLEKKLYLVFLPIFLSIFFVNCKKKDKEIPQIEFLNTNENTNFAYGDYINVRANISDNKTISSVTVSIVDENQKPVLPKFSASPNDSKYLLEKFFLIDDVNLKTGKYQIIINAKDGKNEKNAFRIIYINEAAKSRRGVFVIEADANSTKVQLIDSVLNNYTEFQNRNESFACSEISNYLNQLVIAYNSNSKIESYDLRKNKAAWSQNISAPGASEIFFDLYYRSGIFYSSQTNWLLKGFNASGLAVYNGYLPNVGVLGKVFATEKYVVAEQVYNGISDIKLQTLNRQTGALVQTFSSSFKPFASEEFSTDKLIMVGNEGLRIFEVELNNLWTPQQLPAGQVFDIAKLDNNQYFIAHTNGIYMFRYNPISLLNFKLGKAYSKIKIDNLNNQLFAVDGNNLDVISLNTGTIIKSFTFNNPIKEVHVWYNKE